ncbi:MAG: PadR family transcriptional regulator [Promethearchaeota archaeon]
MLWLGKRKDGTSPLEYVILVLLKKKPRHGNGIIKALNEMYEGLWEASTGTVYPILGRMKSEKKLIEEETVKTPVGPAKKIYKLTPGGEALLDKIVRRDFVLEVKVMDAYTELLGGVVDVSEYRDVLFRALDLLTRGIFDAAKKVEGDELRGRLLGRLKALFEYYGKEIDALEARIPA